MNRTPVNSSRRRHALDSRGFTMLELLVVVVFLAVMAASAFLLLRPKLYAAESMRAERRLEMAALAQALQRYKAANGHFPLDIPTESTIIGRTTDDTYDLCNVLVPDYIKDIPLDPEFGLKYKGKTIQPESGPACNTKNIDYLSGYTIAKTPNGIKLIAPVADKNELSIVLR